MAQVQVITGVERRRRWSDDQKQAIVAAAFAPGAVVADVARQADINAGQIYRWRRDLRVASGGFAEVVVAPIAGGTVGPGAPMIEVMVGDGVHIRIPAGVPPELAAAVVKACR